MARDIAKTEGYRTSRCQRKKVEMLFAHLKRILKLDRLQLPGPNGACDEFHLAATAQNLRKLAMLSAGYLADPYIRWISVSFNPTIRSRGSIVRITPMIRLARASIASVLVVMFGLTGPGHGLTQTITEQREAAVLKARAGHMGEAQKELRAMLAAGVDDNGLVAMDLATLLQQDKKPRAAVAVFEKAALAKPPDYALLAITRAYRDLRRYDRCCSARTRRAAAFSGPDRMAAASIAGVERCATPTRRARDSAPARGAARAAGRTPFGRGLRLASRR